LLKVGQMPLNEQSNDSQVALKRIKKKYYFKGLMRERKKSCTHYQENFSYIHDYDLPVKSFIWKPNIKYPIWFQIFCIIQFQRFNLQVYHSWKNKRPKSNHRDPNWNLHQKVIPMPTFNFCILTQVIITIFHRYTHKERKTVINYWRVLKNHKDKKSSSNNH